MIAIGISFDQSCVSNLRQISASYSQLSHKFRLSVFDVVALEFLQIECALLAFLLEVAEGSEVQPTQYPELLMLLSATPVQLSEQSLMHQLGRQILEVLAVSTPTRDLIDSFISAIYQLPVIAPTINFTSKGRH